MRISRIDIKRDDSILQIENWPSANRFTNVTSQTEPGVQSTTNIVVLSTGTRSACECEDGVCQLGDWKPNRDAA